MLNFDLFSCYLVFISYFFALTFGNVFFLFKISKLLAIINKPQYFSQDSVLLRLLNNVIVKSFIYSVLSCKYVQDRCYLERNKIVKPKFLSLSERPENWLSTYLTKQIAPIYSFAKHILTRITDLARRSYKCPVIVCINVCKYVLQISTCKLHAHPILGLWCESTLKEWPYWERSYHPNRIPKWFF